MKIDSESLGFLLSSATTGTTLNGGGAGAYGSWTTVGTTTKPANHILLNCYGTSGSNRFQVDVRVDGNVIIEDIQWCARTAPISTGFQNLKIPFRGMAPVGSAIEMRMRNSAASQSCFVTVQSGFDPGLLAGGNYASYGIDSAGTVRGVNIDSTPVNVETATPVELTTAGGLDFDTDMIYICHYNADQTVGGTDQKVCRVYYGASAGAAVDSGIKAIFRQSANLDAGWGHVTGPIHVDRSIFKAGERIWFTQQTTDATAGDRNSDYVLIGLDRVLPMGAF